MIEDILADALFLLSSLSVLNKIYIICLAVTFDIPKGFLSTPGGNSYLSENQVFVYYNYFPESFAIINFNGLIM